MVRGRSSLIGEPRVRLTHRQAQITHRRGLPLAPSVSEITVAAKNSNAAGAES